MTARRYASVIRLRPEREEEYRHLHADVWPAVQDRLTESNIGNYSIFLRDGYLVAYFEYTGADFDADMAAMRDDPETRRWWTSPTRVSNPSTRPGPANGGCPWKSSFTSTDVHDQQSHALRRASSRLGPQHPRATMDTRPASAAAILRFCGAPSSLSVPPLRPRPGHGLCKTFEHADSLPVVRSDAPHPELPKTTLDRQSH